MLPSEDGWPDRGGIRYLSQPDQWRKVGSELFDFLLRGRDPDFEN